MLLLYIWSVTMGLIACLDRDMTLLHSVVSVLIGVVFLCHNKICSVVNALKYELFGVSVIETVVLLVLGFGHLNCASVKTGIMGSNWKHVRLIDGSKGSNEAPASLNLSPLLSFICILNSFFFSSLSSGVQRSSPFV